MHQNSYDNNAKLYIVPTPIGNIEDITIRSLKILKESEIIFSEDTRETLKLLKYYDIQPQKLISSHKFNEKNNLKKLSAYLKENKNISVVSDRGTPGISDPGYALIKEAIKQNYNVICLPGPTALIPALIVSGLSPDKFYFYGFLNNKPNKKKKELEKLINITVPIIFYEAPHRIKETIEIMKKTLGNRQASLVREISKKYEEVIRADLDTLIKEVDNIKGELVIIIEGNKNSFNFSELSLEEHLNMYIKKGNTPKDAIKLVAKDRKKPKSEIYNYYHKIKKVNK